MLAYLRRLARRARGVVAECHDAQWRLIQLRASADSYLSGPEQAPDTYREFLYRTSGPLAHEPTAAQRSAGRATR